MADTFKFELVSPQKLLLSAHVTEVIVPGSEGDFTVLRQHAPLVAMLRPGILRVPGMEGALSDVDRGLIEQEIEDAESDLAIAKDEDARRQAADALERLKSLQALLGHAA
jgi:F-type H+-transporting ATPase subunit epsilon